MLIPNLSFLSFFLYLSYYVQGISSIDPLVDTKVGLIRGLRASDGEYSMFMGIPYATVDQENPFGLSIPHPGFYEVFEAHDDSAICPQIEEFNNTIVGTLDCLHLNIYVPNTAASTNPRPVLVWIYGGGFSFGFSSRFLYGPRFLIRHDIILVTFNYRVGPYGFMCLDTPKVPGNQGLKDQLLALKWIKNNIEAFGGDPNTITIAGNSAGAFSVDLHLYYSDEQLFDKVIIQSGPALSPWVFTGPDHIFPLKLADQLGFTTDDINEALTFLSTVDTDLVIAAIPQVDSKLGPCVEKEFNDVKRFIPDHPVNIQPKTKNISVLTGFSKDELFVIYANEGPEFYESLDLFNNYMKKYFNFNDEEVNDMATIVQTFYIGDEPISQEVMWDLAEFDSDFIIIHPTVKSIQRYFENEAKAVFYYKFSYDDHRNFVKDKVNITIPGVGHADELGYLFDISYMKDDLSPGEQYIIDAMTTMWANFVIYGNPTPEITELLPVTWIPATTETMYMCVYPLSSTHSTGENPNLGLDQCCVSSTNIKNIKKKKKKKMYCLEIDSELKMLKRPLHDRMAFWDLFYKQNEALQKGYRNICLF